MRLCCGFPLACLEPCLATRGRCRREGSCTVGRGRWSAARPRDLLVLEEFLVRHGTDDASRVPHHEHPRLDVLRHDRARSDERLLADLDARTEDRAAADARATPDR